MEPELSCMSVKGKKEGFGPLEGGYMVKCDTCLAREYSFFVFSCLWWQLFGGGFYSAKRFGELYTLRGCSRYQRKNMGQSNNQRRYDIGYKLLVELSTNDERANPYCSADNGETK
jgi:hypothetical protein